MTLYRTIVADPPWTYSSIPVRTDRPHRQARERGEVGVAIASQPLPYPSMSADEIAALPISSLASPDCRLFLWATNAYLPEALSLITRWGFGYRQLLVWDKSPTFNPLGGSVAPNACEYLLVATRGAPPRIGRWPTSVIRGRKPRAEHSRKPDVFLDLVESVSPPPYCELFARRNRLGWDTWGNEALAHVDLEAS